MDQEQSKLPRPGRLESLDAYRGFVMICMISAGFGLRGLRDNPGWEWLARQFMHVEWKGCVFWDLIFPMFLFIVGVAMPMAFAARTRKGQSAKEQFRHAIKRTLTLLFIGMVWVCIRDNRVYLGLAGILQSIAIAYFIAFFVLGKGIKLQVTVAVGILVLFWALNQFWPGAGPEGPWAEGARNFDAAFGLWLKQLSHGTVQFYMGSFRAASITIAGIVAGELILRQYSSIAKTKLMIVTGVACVIIGMLLHPLVPIGKNIGTISYSIFSIGWSFLFLSFFYWIIDVKNHRRWSFIFQVVGFNCITVYVFKLLMYPHVNGWILVFTRQAVAALGDLGSIIQSLLVLAVHWYVTYWLYKHKIFIKVG